MASRSLGELLKSAKILQDAAKLTKSYGELNETIRQILVYHLEKVTVQFAPKRPHAWQHHLAVLQVKYGNFSLSIPVPELEALSPELANKVKRKMAPKFTNERVLSVDGDRIWAPSNNNKVPYIDNGYHGGYYWAEPDATWQAFEAEGHMTTLSALGWEEVSRLSGLPLLEIVGRPYDGYDKGNFFWWVEQPQGYDPKEEMWKQLRAAQEKLNGWTTPAQILKHAGFATWTTSVPSEVWWHRVTIHLKSGKAVTHGFNQKKRQSNGTLISRAGYQSWKYLPIPDGMADEIHDTDYRALNLFEGMYGNYEDFVSVTYEYMGGEAGDQVLHTTSVTREVALEGIFALQVVQQIEKEVNDLFDYLEE